MEVMLSQQLKSAVGNVSIVQPICHTCCCKNISPNSSPYVSDAFAVCLQSIAYQERWQVLSNTAMHRKLVLYVLILSQEYSNQPGKTAAGTVSAPWGCANTARSILS